MFSLYFYPRPPGGGRRCLPHRHPLLQKFLSTPSGWRATGGVTVTIDSMDDFYPRPPGGGRLQRAVFLRSHVGISIHALRVEGDTEAFILFFAAFQFLSTPSGWRATKDKNPEAEGRVISIHALRVEGDKSRKGGVQLSGYFYPRPPGGGRPCSTPPTKRSLNFYPRPPGGGRPEEREAYEALVQFLSTPSGWRATLETCRSSFKISNFYPRPPGGGRRAISRSPSYPLLFLSTPSGWRATVHVVAACTDVYGFLSTPSGWRATMRLFSYSKIFERFLSTPSGWRATAKTDKVFICFCAKGRRNCLFKTRKEKICRWRFKKDKFWVLIWCEGSGKSVCALASHCG